MARFPILRSKFPALEYNYTTVINLSTKSQLTHARAENGIILEPGQKSLSAVSCHYALESKLTYTILGKKNFWRHRKQIPSSFCSFVYTWKRIPIPIPNGERRAIEGEKVRRPVGGCEIRSESNVLWVLCITNNMTWWLPSRAWESSEQLYVSASLLLDHRLFG